MVEIGSCATWQLQLELKGLAGLFGADRGGRLALLLTKNEVQGMSCAECIEDVG